LGHADHKPGCGHRLRPDPVQPIAEILPQQWTL
jgi:hypothetical protein